MQGVSLALVGAYGEACGINVAGIGLVGQSFTGINAAGIGLAGNRFSGINAAGIGIAGDHFTGINVAGLWMGIKETNRIGIGMGADKNKRF